MTEPHLLEKAKQGDSQAIESLMNKSLQPKGMTAFVERQGNHLEVVLTADRIPNRQALTAFVEQGMHNLGVETIQSVTVSGQQIGVSVSAWTEILYLALPIPDFKPHDSSLEGKEAGIEPESEQSLTDPQRQELESRLESLWTEQSEEQSRDFQAELSRTRLVINRHRRQAQYFIEDLGDRVNLEMVLIPGGSFVMGAPEEEEESEDSERPQHTVTVQPFCMGKYPVTQAQWRAVAALPQVNRELDSDPSEFKGADRPVERVPWYDAVEFCDRLSQKTGRDYRLPSEAEWEYACRAGTTTPFHFGETITTDLANYNGNYTYGSGPEGTDREGTTPVGSFGIANEFGLYDMHGNVWEWCLDHWHSDYEGAPIDGSAWLTKSENASRLLRGGSWSYLPGFCRSAFRDHFDPGLRYDSVGFRVVCSIRAENQSVPIIHSSSDALTTERSVDYTKLRNLLESGKWKEADEETWKVMVQVTRQEERGYLYTGDIVSFPDTDLRTIDRLWVKYSRGRFGFSVQKHIWYEVNQDWQQFTNRVGWRETQSEMKRYSALTFSIDAPLGHLPFQFGTPDYCWVWGCLGMGSEMGSLLSRQDL